MYTTYANVIKYCFDCEFVKYRLGLFILNNLKGKIGLYDFTN